MFTSDDFRVDDVGELLEFLPILVFIGLCAPYLIGAYTLGFFLDAFKMLD
jgi:hypothetical protein